MSKIISILGGNGYVGKRCIQTLLNASKDVKIYSIGRSQKSNDSYKFDSERVEFIKGDALNPDSFSHILEKSTGIINTIGKLLSVDEDKSPESYKQTNYESCIKTAQLANDLASPTNKKNYVYISAERGLGFPLSLFFSGYISSKRKAEEKILKDFPNLNPVILRPGLINDTKERPYLLPLYCTANLSNFFEKNVLDKLAPQIGEQLNLPAATIELETLSIYAAAGALGLLEDKIISNDHMNEMKNLEKVKF
jgi:nucleoside-diphosphate-sugar epimerase